MTHDTHDRDALLDAVLAVGEDLDLDAMLRRIVAAGRSLVGARYGALGVLTPDGASLSTFIHDGIDAQTAARIGPLPTGHGVLGEVIRTGAPLLLDRIDAHPASSALPPGHPPMHTFLGVPVRVAGEVFGNLYLTDGTRPFTDDDRALVEALAAIAGAAIRNAREARTGTELAMSRDRERIARDLHDTVIQRIFGAGLRLDAVTRQLGPDHPSLAAVESVLTELDAAIAEVRDTIATLQAPPPPTHRQRLVAVLDGLAQIAPALGDVRIDEAVDHIPAELGEMLPAVLREAVTNAARHASASHIAVSVRVEEAHGPGGSGGTVTVIVDDDGVGVDQHPDGTVTGSSTPHGAATHRSGLGLRNLAERAKEHGGSSTLTTGPNGGARLRWEARWPAG